MTEMNRKERRAQEAQRRKEPEKFRLANEERLELYNVHLKRQLIETQVRQQAAIMEREEAVIRDKIVKRHGISLDDYKINLETGECVQKTAEERQQQQMGPRNGRPESLEEPLPASMVGEDDEDDEDFDADAQPPEEGKKEEHAA